jgi:hypothetical protein
MAMRVARCTSVGLASLAVLTLLASGQADRPALASAGHAGATCRWRTVAAANVSDLADVTALSHTEVWAVGTRGAPGHFFPLIVHWNGRKLEVLSAFRPTSDDAALMGIAAVSRTDVWAVGWDGDRAVSEHWDGTRWQVIPTPSLRGSAFLNGVAALAQSDVWAVGQVGTRPLVEHWDGRAWHVVGIRREGALYAVDGASPSNVWAVGAQGLQGSVNFISGLVLHWNGRRWQEVQTPSRDDGDLGYETSQEFSKIDVVSTTEAWAIHDGVVRGDIQRWNGSQWRMVHVFPAKSILADVAAVSSQDVWAVGPGSNVPREARPLIVHWDGRSWRVQHTPLQRLRATLNGLAVLSPSDIWAAGNHLIAQYSC